MNDMILDVKVKIATSLAHLTYPEDVFIWNLFLLYDEEFKKYVFTREGRNTYISNFAKIENSHDKSTKFYVFECFMTNSNIITLFGRYNSVYDKPSLVNNGIKIWHRNNIRHRDGDKPAYNSKEYSIWYRHGELHRDGDKPAIICRHFDGNRFIKETRSWWVDDIFYKYEDNGKFIYNSDEIPYDDLQNHVL
jgi:hypothetical protein